MTLERIYQIIEEENLRKKSNKPEHVYRRYFLANWMRNQNIKLTTIGKAFNRNHSTIINGINRMSNYKGVNDELFLLHTKDLHLEFFGEKVPLIERNLYDDVKCCINFQDLAKIKARIRQNEYNRDLTFYQVVE